MNLHTPLSVYSLLVLSLLILNTPSTLLAETAPEETTITFQVQKGGDYYLSKSFLEITDLKTGQIRYQKCGNDGKFRMRFGQQQNILVRAFRHKYMHAGKKLDLAKTSTDHFSVGLGMQPVQEGRSIGYRNIKFSDGRIQFDLASISDLSAIERLLCMNEDIEVQLGVHNGLNLDKKASLSESKTMVAALKKYFEVLGMGLSSRIGYQAYGNTKLVSKLPNQADGVIELLVTKRFEEFKVDDQIPFPKEEVRLSNFPLNNLGNEALEHVVNALMKEVKFEQGSDMIQETSFKALDLIAKLMKRSRFDVAIFTGHTDNIGSEEFNLRLSLLRAQKTKLYLVTSGLEETRLLARGGGETNPTMSNANKSGRARNRRVEVQFTNSEASY